MSTRGFRWLARVIVGYQGIIMGGDAPSSFPRLIRGLGRQEIRNRLKVLPLKTSGQEKDSFRACPCWEEEQERLKNSLLHFILFGFQVKCNQGIQYRTKYSIDFSFICLRCGLFFPFPLVLVSGDRGGWGQGDRHPLFLHP